MLRDCPNLTTLLSASRPSLINNFTISAVLSQDLYKAQYVARPVFESSSESSEDEPPRKSGKRKSRASSSSKDAPSTTSPIKTLNQLRDESDIDDESARQGILDDETGQQLFIIERVIKYEPKFGYYVHWQGYPKSERSWQRTEDMPQGMKEEMRKARERYREEVKRSRTNLF